MTAFKTTQKQIRAYAKDACNNDGSNAWMYDITDMPYKEAQKLIDDARARYIDDNGYLEEAQIAYSSGTYGCNGWVWKIGYCTFVCYKCTTTLYLLP